MFAFEWCEFCWAVRKMFARFKIPYRSIDLDSVEYQQGGRGQAIRTALTSKTSVATIPQIFVGGQLLGGATDVLSAWKQGRLQPLLDKSRVRYDASSDIDTATFLPGWLHPR